MRAMRCHRKFPDVILYLAEGQGFTDHHPVFCVHSRRRLLLITAFSSLKDCHIFLSALVSLKLVALFADTVVIGSLTHSKQVKRSGTHSSLAAEEWKKVLKAHHPLFRAFDPVSGLYKLGRIRDFVPKLQPVFIFLWALLCLACARFASSWWQNIRIPCFLTAVVVGLEWIATIMSISIQVKRQVILGTD